MAIRLAGGNQMIWSWRDKTEARKDEGITRGTKAKHGQLAVGNEGEFRYSRSDKGDRYHDARWQENGGRRLSMRAGTFIDAIPEMRRRLRRRRCARRRRQRRYFTGR